MEYDTALKKLINILKFKNTDTIKKIEDFWDELGTVNIIKKTDDYSSSQSSSSSIHHHHQHHLTSGGGGASSNSSNGGCDDNGGKLTKTTTTTATTTYPVSAIKRPPPSSLAENFVSKKLKPLPSVKSQLKDTMTKPQTKPIEQKSIPISKIKSPPPPPPPLVPPLAQSSSQSNQHDTTNNIEMTIESEIELDNSNSGKKPTTATTIKNDDLFTNETINGNNIDEYVMEMGLTCDICKLLVQEQNNKLAECQECKRLYHQKCHKPIITNEEISDPRMLWYCSKCVKTVKKQITNNVNNTIKSHQQKSNELTNKTSPNGGNESTINQQQTKLSQQQSNTPTQVQFKRQTSSELSAFQQQTKIQQDSTSHSNELSNEYNNNHYSNNDSSSNSTPQKTTTLYFKRDPKQTNTQTNDMTNIRSSQIMAIDLQAPPQQSQPQQQQQQQQSQSSTNKALKGLAGLATKFNSSINKDDPIIKKPSADNQQLKQSNSSGQLQQQQQQQQNSKPLLLYNQINSMQQKLKQNGNSMLTNSVRPLTSFKQTILLESVPLALKSTTTTTSTPIIHHDHQNSTQNNSVVKSSQNNVDFLKTKQLAKAKIS